MSAPNLLDAARGRVVLGDGAMGTELQRAGLEPGGCGDLWNLDRPERVRRIQEAYIAAGAELLLTNTFGSNRFVLARYDAQERVRELNLAGARVARRAAGPERWVLGDIGPFGGFLAPLGETTEAELYDAFREQAGALVEGGVDGIIVETMTALDELRVAVRAARDAGAAFVIGSVAFDATRAGLRTMMGTTPQEAARALLEAGAHALGANCGTRLGMAEYAEIVRRYRQIAPDHVVMVQANAGQPELVGSDVVYGETPEAMAAGIAPLAAAGASIIGGCCGTTPDHIAAFARALGR